MESFFFWHIAESMPLIENNVPNTDFLANIQPLEVVDLCNATKIDVNPTEVSGKQFTITLELSRNWLANDVSGPFQKIVGNLLIRKLLIAVSNSEELNQWSRLLTTVINSHHEWKK